MPPRFLHHLSARSRWLLASALLGSWGLASAQSTSSRIADSAHLLSAENHAALAAELESLFETTGCSVFVKAETYLDSGVTARSAARVARRQIAATGPTALFLSDRSRDSIAISQSPDLWQRYPMATLVENLRAAMQQAQTADLTPEQRLIRCIKTWAEGIRELEQERRASQQMITPSQRPIALGFGATLGLGTLAAMLLGWRDRKSLAADQQQILFPEIQVTQRLGAPYGGGVTAHLPALSTSSAPPPAPLQ